MTRIIEFDIKKMNLILKKNERIFTFNGLHKIKILKIGPLLEFATKMTNFRFLEEKSLKKGRA